MISLIDTFSIKPYYFNFKTYFSNFFIVVPILCKFFTLDHSLKSWSCKLSPKNKCNIRHRSLKKYSTFQCFNTLISSFLFGLVGHNGIINIVYNLSMNKLFRLFHQFNNKLIYSFLLFFIIEIWLKNCQIENWLFILHQKKITIEAIPKSPKPEEMVNLTPNTTFASDYFVDPYKIIFFINSLITL